MPEIGTTASSIGWSGTSVLALISEAILASLFAAALLVATSGTRRFHGMGFAALFVYVLWRYTIPAFFFSWFMFWLLWGRSTP